MKRNTLIIILSIFSLTNCSVDKENLTTSGINTRLFGKLTSFNNNPASNVLIKVAEYKESGGGSFFGGSGGGYHIEFIQFVKEIYTDNQGKYDFVFQTSGKGNFYRIEVGEYTKPNVPQTFWDSFVYDLSDSGNSSKIIGKEFEMNNNNSYNLFPCDVNIQMNNVQILPVYPKHSKTFEYNLTEINANQNQIKRIYIDKYETQFFELYRVKPNGTRQRARYSFPASNLEILTTQNIVVNEIDFIDI
jgi:hypothetical protein